MAGLLAATSIPPALVAAGASSHGARRVPDVVGLPRADVYREMRGAQLYFTTHGPGSASGSWRSAAAQSPRAGTLVAWHATIAVTTSMAAGHALRRVPRVAGLSRTRVFAAMRHAQLYFRTTGPGSASGTWRSATGVTPRAGTLVRWHSTVVVRTSLHRTLTKRKHPVTTTTHRTTTTRAPTTTRPATTTTAAPTTTYPGETTTTGATTTTAATTTSVHVTTTTAKPKAKPHRYRIGLATWYSYFPGRCATSYLPFGTRIHVRDLANGRTVTCVVTDREGKGDGRVVDLSEAQFAQLAPLWRGVVRVKVSW